MKAAAVSLLVLVLCAGSRGDDAGNEIENSMKECTEKHGVNKHDFFKITMDHADPTAASAEMKCAIHCFLVKLGFMDKTGKVEVEIIRGLLEATEPDMVAAFDKCINVTHSHPCESAFLQTKCLYDERT